MNRPAFASAAALLFVVTTASPALAQVQAAAPVAPTDPARAKFATPLKGDGTVDVFKSNSKVVGTEIVTTFKIKNTSSAPLAMLKIDEYWYDKGGKLVSSDTRRHRQPLQPGEIAEMETRAPSDPGALNANWTANWTFSHANGKIKANPVKVMKKAISGS